ncbi:centrosome-associated protein 350 [Aplysia californica]|uniref:Centrosome-associated protein 350 n=1 Tax=Aplysia californica TaxID=6500 RepID=A0ABM0ZWY8_APLCA|nr:centrosome-associated protein 350 [Aplysia californica]
MEGAGRGDVTEQEEVSPRRARPIKKSITGEFKDNEIMHKLKERLKHQRALAASSSASASNDTSLADSSASGEPPPALPPRQPLTGEATGGQAKPRKVAAAQPARSYRGFSEASVDSARTFPKSSASSKKKSSSGRKAPLLQTKRQDAEGAAPVRHVAPSANIPDRPKKVARVVAFSDRKSSKSGAKNVITTSSWRAGQELVMKELGMALKAKAKSMPSSGTAAAATGEEPAAPSRDAALAEVRREGRQPDGAESTNPDAAKASAGARPRDPETEAVVANARALSEDARNMLSELKLGNSESSAGAGFRPAVKRKAPKWTEPEPQQQPTEKSRHYDPESVRRYMAKQKADRIKKIHDEKAARQRDNEKRQQILTDLAQTQRKKAVTSAKSRGQADGGRKVARDRSKGGQAGTGKSDKENVAMDMDQDDDSTLTEDTEDDSTPQATPRKEETKGKHRKHKSDPSRQQPLMSLNSMTGGATTTTGATATMSALATTGETDSPSKAVEIKGHKLDLDVDTVLSRFSQVVQQRRGLDPAASSGSAARGPASGAQGTSGQPGPETVFALGTTNSVARTNEERKKVLQATAMSLQARLAEEKRKFEALDMRAGGQQPEPSSSNTTRHSRIVGNRTDHAVFTTDLPGSRALVGSSDNMEREEMAAARIQAAYRGHNVRQALNWELPSGQTFGQRMKGGHRSKEPVQGGEADEDASELTETSTFSEITATEASDGGHHAATPATVPGNKRSHHSSRPKRPEGVSDAPPPATFKPSSQYAWHPSQADPFNVMSVFTRQNRYVATGSDQPDLPHRSSPATSTSRPAARPAATADAANNEFLASLDLTSLKQPVITTDETVVMGHTASGMPLIAKHRLTRLEATATEKVPKDEEEEEEEGYSEASSQSSRSANLPSRASHSRPGAAASLRSNEAGSRVEKSLQQASVRSEHGYSMSFESDEEATPVPHSNQKRSGAAGSYVRQVSDAGQETDVSQMSEDEPRHMRSKLDSNAGAPRVEPQLSTVSRDKAGVSGAARGRSEPEGGRLSPNSLANKLSANLNYLESMEESLRQLTGVERARAVALAQQETVSVAQVLKARQQEHESELRTLQDKVQREAWESTHQLDKMKRQTGASLLEKEDNRRPDSRSYGASASARTVSRSEDLSQSPGNRRTKRSSAATSLASVTKVTSSSRTASGRERSSLTTSVKTAADSRDDSDSSIKTASDVDVQDSRTASVPEEIAGEEEASYSMSFDESITDEESFRQVLPSESHRKELRRQSGEGGNAADESDDELLEYPLVSSHVTPYGDLSSLFVGEDSFNKFTAEMVRQVMREEEYRAQHQAALLKLREKALKEKARAELAWLQQLKKQPRDKRADDVFPNLDKKEKIIRKNLQEQQEEIRRLQEANKVASEERQRLLQQHEEIARIKQRTQNTLVKLKVSTPSKGRLDRPSEVHTEDEIEEASDVSDDLKDSKSDTEMYRSKAHSDAQQGQQNQREKMSKLRLDQRYMTAREHKLYERKKHAKELLEWKKRLDAEEAKVFLLEKKAIQAWEGKQRDKKKDKEETPAKKPSKPVKPVAASRRDDSTVISERLVSSIRDEMEGGTAAASATAGRSRTGQGSVSEAISTQLSISQTETSPDKKSRSRSERAWSREDNKRSPGASGSESSIPEEVPTGTAQEKQKALDSSDDTLINSSANDDYADTFEQDGTASVTSRKKSSVGKLLPQGNSPLPSPWSRKTGSESESEDSISHTETLSDASDYEVRIRQLSDELRRRRKEVEILKKERSRRQKEKLKVQEDAMKKQLEAYNNYIQQLKVEKEDLEHEPAKTAVKPQIKQPRGGHQVKGRPGRHGDDAASNSSSFEDMREGTDSNQTSPNVEAKDLKGSPVEEKGKKKAPVSLMDRISEGSESLSDKSGASGKGSKLPVAVKRRDDVSEKTTTSSSVAEEVIEEASQSEKTSSGGLIKIQMGAAAAASRGDSASKGREEEENSYSMDFSELQSSLAQSHAGKLPLSARSQGSVTGADLSHKGARSEVDISEHIEEAISLQSPSVASQPKFDFTNKSQPQDSPQDSPQQGPSSPPTTGIQESDSETESRVNCSAKSEGSSRPSSERSVGSMSYMEEDEEDAVSFASDRTPVRSPSHKSLPPVQGAGNSRLEEEISEHISASLPSISEKRSGGSLRQDSQDVLDDLLGYKEGEDEDDKTPVATPREMAPTPVPEDEEEEEEEENASLLQTDPLADFLLEDRVLVWGRRPGRLKYKGKVDFSPGIWAGVELDTEEGDSDGLHEGKRYFSCRWGHGVMVHGSDISAFTEQPAAVPSEDQEARSPDESLTTDQDDSSNVQDVQEPEKTILPAADASMFHSTPLGSPQRQADHTQKPTATPVKGDMTALADKITDQLTSTLIEDSFETVGKIASQKSPTPATPPKPAATTTTTKKADSPADGSAVSEQQKGPASSPSAPDRTTDGVMKTLLDEAILDMVKIKRKKAESAKDKTSLMNGILEGGEDSFDDDEDDDEEEKIQDNDSGLSMDPFQRPGSPVPSDAVSTQDRKDLNDDLNNLFGEYIDDDLGFEQSTTTGKAHPTYPGDQTPTAMGERGLVIAEEIPPVVAHTKEEIIPIVSRAVDVFWTTRRYGESLEDVEPPEDFLQGVSAEDEEEEEGGPDNIVSQSRRSWHRMLFDLTGEIIRDIYKDDDQPEPQVWQPAQRPSHRHYRGARPPCTVDTLQPVVQEAVLKLLDLNGTRRTQTQNKWNVRKKKDAVDAVLVQELGEEERGWVNYSQDELNLKMSLADSLFDSLLSDTVSALNGIYQKRHLQAQQL